MMHDQIRTTGYVQTTPFTPEQSIYPFNPRRPIDPCYPYNRPWYEPYANPSPFRPRKLTPEEEENRNKEMEEVIKGVHEAMKMTGKEKTEVEILRERLDELKNKIAAKKKAIEMAKQEASLISDLKNMIASAEEELSKL